MTDPTTRAYTLKLTGEANWRDLLWQTHVTVNRGAQAWGDWLLTLRGGLSPSLATDHPERRVLLALSWLSVESPSSLIPKLHIVAGFKDSNEDRKRKVMQRFGEMLKRLNITAANEWIEACEPALTARIRDDAVWVDRFACFREMQLRCPGLDSNWAANTLFDFIGNATDYFALPDEEAVAAADGKDFVQKAGGWLSRNWGSGEKSDSTAISSHLRILANANQHNIVGNNGTSALSALLMALEQVPVSTTDADGLFKQLKQSIGWKGRPSKGALALEKIRDADRVTTDLWKRTVEKLTEESSQQSSKSENSAAAPDWMANWRSEFEMSLTMPYRVDRDLIWEHGVTLDHALRRVSAAHTWIKRAEVERRRFRDDAAKIAAVPTAARDWLDAFCEIRSSASGALGDYVIRKRAIDGWDKIVQAWAALGAESTRKQRIEAAREVQSNLDDNDKFGDIQLFAGFGDEDADSPQTCLADDDAICVWRDANDNPSADILKDYVSATVAEQDQRRFKVPAYRHPDSLRHPVYVDFGNSRWGITYSALKCAQQRQKDIANLDKAKTDKVRAKLQQQLDNIPNLRGVTLDVWNGQLVESLSLCWQGKRLWKDLDLDHFGNSGTIKTVSRADRLGRVVEGQESSAAVNIAEVFQQKDWNGRLQVPRDQLDRLADLIYGKNADPDYAKLEGLARNPCALKLWENLNWFLTTSAKLQPRGPWLDYVAAAMPDGIAYKKGRSGYYLDYVANQGRKSRARLQLARLPGLRILSLDLGHRYAAACAVWLTVPSQKLIDECQEAGQRLPQADDLYFHIRRQTEKIQKSGRNKGQPVTETTIYRRIGPDQLPDGSNHPAPWARLERQFLIRLQGEDRSARPAQQHEIDGVNNFRTFLGLPPMAEVPRVNDLQKDAVRLAQLGLRRLGDAARIAFAMTATKKPISGGREVELRPAQRVEYLQDALVLWQELAGSNQYHDAWAKENWNVWIVNKLEGPQPVAADEDLDRSARKKKIDSTRGPLKAVAEKLADPQSQIAVELHKLWNSEWQHREHTWHMHLRWLRRFILPSKNDSQQQGRDIRRVGGLSMQRIKTIRDLYQVLKAFRMKPEPDNLRKNVPELGDESLAKFGRRILNQHERLREQRIKQLASRLIEAALGAGRIKRPMGRELKRPQQSVDLPCHAVVVEDLEHYRPEDSRLRRENRQLMEWSARNVRKYIMEGCELHGLHFVEVSPSYTSRQDSRTGAPGIRCEDIARKVLDEAAKRAHADSSNPADKLQAKAETSIERSVRRWTREIKRVEQAADSDLSARDRLLRDIVKYLPEIPANRSTIRLPRRGGELFVSANPNSSGVAGIQADLNAGANIGLKALTDPDWWGAWWFVLVNVATGQPTPEKITGCPFWKSGVQIWPPPATAESDPAAKTTGKRSTARIKRSKTDVYAWSSQFIPCSQSNSWLASKPYWDQIEANIAARLASVQSEPENPF